MPWMNEGLAQHDAVGLSMFDYGFRQTTTKGVPVNSAADLKGVKILRFRPPRAFSPPSTPSAPTREDRLLRSSTRASSRAL